MPLSLIYLRGPYAHLISQAHQNNSSIPPPTLNTCTFNHQSIITVTPHLHQFITVAALYQLQSTMAITTIKASHQPSAAIQSHRMLWTLSSATQPWLSLTHCCYNQTSIHQFIITILRRVPDCILTPLSLKAAHHQPCTVHEATTCKRNLI
ncbi:hypothetical protein M0R45_006479 [Rubus argutus]|uniref:Uncharacterized protein n=1 Tax=Rubus argutus TaxID=59490 RepID=A0AAW1YQQ8_RUBAR